MKRTIVCLGCFLFCTAAGFSQAKSKAPVKQPLSELNKLLVGTNLPYKMVNDSLAAIPYEGENIAAYTVVIQRISDLYIVYTNLTETLPKTIEESKYKYLLQQNDHFDIVKISLNPDKNMLFLRADVYTTGISTALLQRIIRQVANVTNIIAGELK